MVIVKNSEAGPTERSPWDEHRADAERILD
jgi:hypothetical protein